MEFKRLADVDIVETANDTDKVLIEQNGEIKRVPKTEVGGSGSGKTLVIDCVVNYDDEGAKVTDVTANMTLDEVMTAITNRELIGTIAYESDSGGVYIDTVEVILPPEESGFIGVVVYLMYAEVELFWTADGFSMEPPPES